jgi:hypothetical protein
VEQQAEDLGQHSVASAAAGDLINLLHHAGHFEAAPSAVERKKEYTRRAGLGRWTQLGNETRRLQILNGGAHYEAVLAAVNTGREEI